MLDQRQRRDPWEQRRYWLRFVFGLLLAVTLAGCGASGRQPAPADREASLRQIAAEYSTAQDINRAKASLDKLGLANPGQLLVSLAENDLARNRPATEVAPLARLAEALGARSPKLIAYLMPTAAPTLAPPSPTPLPPSPTTPPTATPVPATPTVAATPVPATAAPSPTPQRPRVTTEGDANVRGGPGTNYPVVGKLAPGSETDIIGRTTGSDWWRIAWQGAGQAWVSGSVVKALGPLDAVAVAKDIPAPPPTAVPAAPPTATQPPKPAGPDFRVISVRLWGVVENGGYFDGPSVHCGEKRQLRVFVKDAAGNPLNGVTVKAEYGNKEEEVTGSKGGGLAEFILGGGQDVFIVRDVDGRQPSSDYARGMSTDPSAIPTDVLIGAGYCKDAADCAQFVGQGACRGHYSWDVIYQRAY